MSRHTAIFPASVWHPETQFQKDSLLLSGLLLLFDAHDTLPEPIVQVLFLEACREKSTVTDPAIYPALTPIGVAVPSSGCCGSSGFAPEDRRVLGVSRLNCRIL